MKSRIALEIVLGIIIAAAFFWWLYLRPRGPETLPPDSPLIQKSISDNREKLLLIGIDAMDWDVAMELVNQGRMPNLSRLLTKGGRGNLVSEAPYISPALWTTFATGVSRDEHGIDNFVAKVPFQYKEVIMTSRYRKVPALWQMMTWAGRSVGVVNWYATYPAEEVKGVFVAQEVIPGKVDKEAVYPAEWTEKVSSAPLPEYEPYQRELARVGDARMQRAYDLDRAAFSVAFEIMREKHPDLMLVYLRQLDVLCHGFWKYRWPLGLDYHYEVSRDERERYKGVIELHYELVDRLIGGLLSEAEGYTVMVISDHGHGATYSPRNIFPRLNHLMERLGHLDYAGVTCDEIMKSMAALGRLHVPRPRSANIFGLCAGLEEQVKTRLQRGEEMDALDIEAYVNERYELERPENRDELEDYMRKMTLLASRLAPEKQRQDINWGKTEAWNIEDFHKRVQGIYVNLEGREPEGIVPREEYDDFCGRLKKRLKSLRTEKGDRLFKMVKINPAKEVMPVGVDDPPDVLVEVNRKALVHEFAMSSPGDKDPIPLAAVRFSYSDVSGDHTPKGVFIVSGPSCRAAKRVDATVYDICPTILWRLGLPVGADMPGSIMVDAFDGPFAKRGPLYIGSWKNVIRSRVDSPPVPLAPEKKREFRDIGYIQ